MKAITLKSSQLSRVLTDESLEIEDNVRIEIQNKEFILNIGGIIHELNEAKLQFDEPSVELSSSDKHKKNLLCKHLNLEPCQIIRISRNGTESEFRIKFSPKNICYVVVCDFRQAIQNMNAIVDETLNFSSDDDYIGLYKKLGNTLYYFRWIENDFANL